MMGPEVIDASGPPYKGAPEGWEGTIIASQATAHQSRRGLKTLKFAICVEAQEAVDEAAYLLSKAITRMNDACLLARKWRKHL